MIETLAAGDLVTTMSGDIKPVAWIGRRVLTAADTANGRSTCLPVRIRAHVFAENVPHRDLLVTH